MLGPPSLSLDLILSSIFLQVVEISSLSDHLLNECDVKANYTQCNKCGIAVLKTDFQQHKKSTTCKGIKYSLYNSFTIKGNEY